MNKQNPVGIIANSKLIAEYKTQFYKQGDPLYWSLKFTDSDLIFTEFGFLKELKIFKIKYNNVSIQQYDDITVMFTIHFTVEKKPIEFNITAESENPKNLNLHFNDYPLWLFSKSPIEILNFLIKKKCTKKITPIRTIRPIHTKTLQKNQSSINFFIIVVFCLGFKVLRTHAFPILRKWYNNYIKRKTKTAINDQKIKKKKSRKLNHVNTKQRNIYI